MKNLLLILTFWGFEIQAQTMIIDSVGTRTYQIMRPQIPRIGIIRSQNVHVDTNVSNRQLIGVLASKPVEQPSSVLPPPTVNPTVTNPLKPEIVQPNIGLAPLPVPDLKNTLTTVSLAPLVTQTAENCNMNNNMAIETCYQKEINRYFTEYRYSGISEADFEAAQRRWGWELNDLYAENTDLKIRLNRLISEQSRQRIQQLPSPTIAPQNTVIYAPTKRDTVYIRQVQMARDTVYVTRTVTQNVPSAPITQIQEIERSILETGLFSSVQILFETGSAAIKPSSKTILDNLGVVLKKYPQLKFEIEGHTDAVGSEASNIILSQRRSEAVKQYLVSNFGILADHLTPKGYGEAIPVAPNTTRNNKAMNRRVALKVVE